MLCTLHTYASCCEWLHKKGSRTLLDIVCFKCLLKPSRNRNWGSTQVISCHSEQFLGRLTLSKGSFKSGDWDFLRNLRKQSWCTISLVVLTLYCVWPSEEEGRSGGQSKFMDVFIKAPEATPEKIAGTVLSFHFSPLITHLCSPSLIPSPSLTLLTPVSPACPAAYKENPSPVGYILSLPVGQRALPIIIFFLSGCSAWAFPFLQCHKVPAEVKPTHIFSNSSSS